MDPPGDGRIGDDLVADHVTMTPHIIDTNSIDIESLVELPSGHGTDEWTGPRNNDSVGHIGNQARLRSASREALGIPKVCIRGRSAATPEIKIFWTTRLSDVHIQDRGSRSLATERQVLVTIHRPKSAAKAEHPNTLALLPLVHVTSISQPSSKDKP